MVLNEEDIRPILIKNVYYQKGYGAIGEGILS